MKKNNIDNDLISTEGRNKLPSVVLRKCCACGKISDRNDFIRLLKCHKSGEVIISPNNKQFGKSVYLCKDKECLRIAVKKKRLKFLSDEQLQFLENLCI